MAKKKPANKPAEKPKPKASRGKTKGAGWRHDGLPSLKQAQFLAAYAECGNVTHAAKVAGVHRDMHYTWSKNEEYKAKFKDAHEQACDTLEKEARRRAVDGYVEPVYGSGGQGVGTVQVGSIRKYSDLLLIFLLKGARPDKYRENSKVQVEGNLNHTGNVQIFIPDNSRD